MAFAQVGCTVVGPNYTPPNTKITPARYLASDEVKNAPNGPLLITQWQQVFDDAVLCDLLQHALSNNLDLSIAIARLQQARALQAVQEEATGPTVDFDTEVSEDKLSKDSELYANIPSTPGVKTQFLNTQIGFDASWEIDLFGFNRRQTEAAQARSASTAEHVNDVRLSLGAEVTRNYLELRTWQQRQQLAQTQLQDWDTEIAIAQQAVQRGERAKIDLERMQIARTNFAATLPSMVLSERQNEAVLSVLTVLPLADLQAMLQALSPLPSVPAAPTAGLPGDLLQHRPDIRSAERDLAAANADVGAATAAKYPRLSLLGNGGWASVNGTSVLGNASALWNFGPSLSVPLFNSGRLDNQQKASEAALQIAQANYRKIVIAAVSEVEVALTRMARNEDQRAQLLQAQDQQQRILARTQAQFNEGDVSRITLLDAQRALNTQEDQTLQAQSHSLTALIALYKALGGGWAE